jgi:hypothetical protein
MCLMRDEVGKTLTSNKLWKMLDLKLGPRLIIAA